MSNPEPVIRVQGISRSYFPNGAEIQVLRGLDLEVRQGEFLAIMGPSGSGKSTLLHILGCLDRPGSGHYRLFDREVQSLDDASLSRIRAREIGFVFQKFHLLPQLTVLENVELPSLYSKLEGISATEALAQVGLSQRLNHRPSELSGGEMQRVAIARALITSPRLILADEPTGNLDAGTGSGILDLLAKINSGGTTVVVVTHDPEVARRAARVLVLERGRFES